MKVIVFSTPDCANCKPLKAALSAADVDFREVNCHEPAAFTEMRIHGVRSVPTTVVMDQELTVFKVTGNKPQEIVAFLQGEISDQC